MFEGPAPDTITLEKRDYLEMIRNLTTALDCLLAEVLRDEEPEVRALHVVKASDA